MLATPLYTENKYNFLFPNYLDRVICFDYAICSTIIVLQFLMHYLINSIRLNLLKWDEI